MARIHRNALSQTHIHFDQSFIKTLVSFQIKPLDVSAPEVVKLLPMWKAEPLDDGRYGIFVSSHELKAHDSDSRDEELRFCISRQPFFGYLENITTGQPATFVSI